jgi:hypothetical protein
MLNTRQREAPASQFILEYCGQRDLLKQKNNNDKMSGVPKKMPV